MKKKIKLTNFRRLFSETKPQHGALSIILGLSLLGAVLGLLTPWLYREIINFLTIKELSPFFANLLPETEGIGILLYLVGTFLIIDLVSQGIAEWQGYLERMTERRIYLHFLREGMARLLALPMHFFESRSTGWIQQRVNGGASNVSSIVQAILVNILPTLFTFAVAVIVMFQFNSTLALVFAGIGPIYIGISVWRNGIMKKWEKKSRSSYENHWRVYIDSIVFHQLLKEFAREDAQLSQLARMHQKILEIHHSSQTFNRWTNIAREVIYTFGYVWVYGYGGYLVLTGSLLVGDLVLFVAYLERVLGPLGGVMRIYDIVTVGMVAVERMFKLWDYKNDVPDVVGAAPLVVATGKIEFKNVRFTYKKGSKYREDKEVLRGINLTIEPKEVVALVGPSGVGKSTLVKLLMRFYDPVKGKILIDGQDISQIQQKTLRRQIATVMQDVTVLNDTVSANIRYADKHAKEVEVERSVKLANLHDFVMSLRQKLKTKIGVRGVKLSGGEKQRLAIARAVLKDSPILVLDEATSALDSENEKKIQDAMWNLVKDRTTLIIAHRLSTIKKADKIVVLQNGRITEVGKHSELMKKKDGYYRRMFTMQGEMLSTDL